MLSFQVFGQTLPIPEILYYKFNESGTTVTNYASAPPAGTATANIMGGITQGTAGSSCDGALIGSGLSASSDYLNTGWAPNIGTGAWSIVFTTSGFSNVATLYYIFGDANTASFRCFTNGVAGNLNWIIRGAGITDTYINGGALTSETICAYVFDPVTNTIKGYLNGGLVTTVPQTTVNISGAGPFKVMGYAANVGAPAGGLMEEFMMYNHALTDAEVLQLYLRQTSDTIAVSSCGDYTAPSGAVFTTSGNYNDIIPNSYCGDSIINIDLTISSPTFDTIAVSSCSDYTAPSGFVYTTSGIYNDTISNAAGCDSIINIDLTILTPTYDTIQVVECDTYIAPSGAVFTTSGIYNDTILNAAGCDSIITIDLVVNYSSADTLSLIECDVYDAPDGSQITTSGIYDLVIPNAVGCDSLIHVDLTILTSTSSIITETVCDSYTAPDGATYTQSGNFVATIPNAIGCDSVISINLTVNSVNSNVTQSGITISSDETGAAYQWIDCGTGLVIPNETSASFTATANGSYAVIVTKNGCTDTSNCIAISTIGLSENSDANISVYPNPATTTLTIQNTSNAAAVFSLMDASGKVLRTVSTSDEKIEWNIEQLPAGIYSLTVNYTHAVNVFKVVKL